jgi:heme oxygenase
VTLLDRLKAASQRDHHLLESDLNLLRPGFDLTEYADLLERFYGFHAAWEERARPLLESELPGFLAPRRRAHRAATDLRWLHRTPEDLPWCACLPLTRTLAATLGSMYVLEGSTLGGQVLARHFEQILHLTDGGCAFFRGYGDATGEMWRSFREQLVESASDSPEEAVEAAIDTFRAAHRWLCEEPA